MHIYTFTQPGPINWTIQNLFHKSNTACFIQTTRVDTEILCYGNCLWFHISGQIQFKSYPDISQSHAYTHAQTHPQMHTPTRNPCTLHQLVVCLSNPLEFVTDSLMLEEPIPTSSANIITHIKTGSGNLHSWSSKVIYLTQYGTNFCIVALLLHATG